MSRREVGGALETESGPAARRVLRASIGLALAIGFLALAALLLLGGERTRVPRSAAFPAADPARSVTDRQARSVPGEMDPRAGRDPIAAGEPLPSRRALEVRVEDRAGLPIAAAFVWLRSGEARDPDEPWPVEGGRGSSAARTDARGRAALEPEESAPSGGYALIASAEGFQERRIRLEAPLPRNATVLLEPSPGIAGIVVRADGLPVGAGIRVVAVARDAGPVGREAALRALEGSPLVHSTLTAEDGRFRLAGVRAGTSYHLEAGGNGMATAGARPGRTQVAEAGALDVELLLVHLYQCVIEHVDQDGAPVLSALVASQEPTSIGSRDGRLRACSARRAAALLAGQDPALAELPRHIGVYLFESDGELDPAGPVDLRLRTPGFAPLDFDLLARPLSQETHIERLRLQRTAAALVELEVRFVRRARPVAPVPGRLHFYGEDGRSAFSVFWSRDTSVEPARLGSFPAGRFTWRFESNRGPFVYPPVDSEPGRLDTEQGTELEIALDSAGTLSVEILDPAGEPFRGRASMVIEPGSIYLDSGGLVRTGGSKLVISRGPPFLIEGLPVGRELELILVSPASGSQPGADRALFQIDGESGESRVQVRLESAD